MKVKLIECPRDAMQGWSHFIPTEKKIDYLNLLLQCGFDTLDFGSFVSPKAIPQLADTKDVIPKLKLDQTQTKLLAIIANTRGAEEACGYEQIQYLGFPFSISETFQLKNTNSTIRQSLQTVEQIQTRCVNAGKEAVIYISMGFGNPYGDTYNSDIAIGWVEELSKLGVRIFSMSDTVGVSNPDNISYIYSNLIGAFKQLEFGAHFHSTPETRKEKLESAFAKQCFRYDSAIKGIGGCPMAMNDLVGNMATETLIEFLSEKNIDPGLNMDKLNEAILFSSGVFV